MFFIKSYSFLTFILVWTCLRMENMEDKDIITNKILT